MTALLYFIVTSDEDDFSDDDIGGGLTLFMCLIGIVGACTSFYFFDSWACNLLLNGTSHVDTHDIINACIGSSLSVQAFVLTFAVGCLVHQCTHKEKDGEI